MSYKTVLVHVDASPQAPSRIACAGAIAAAEKDSAGPGHLVGAATTGVSRFLYRNIPSANPDANLELHLDFLRAQARQALDGFAARARALGVGSFEERVLDDEAGGGISLMARYADLVVISQFDPAQPSPSVMADFPEYVVLHAGRPVLVLPHAADSGSADAAQPGWSRNILIAWNASKEASRAVSAALPLLKRAGKVSIAIVDLQHNAEAHGRDPGADIALYLKRHGVGDTSIVRRETPARGLKRPADAGETLLSLAAELAADLLVMGAYGHSRFREIILGGATRSILKSMTLPVLMMH
ncbi:MAG TPA: universal stress protein [Janthinobacterium sp.]|jgi:nucleotide-binding universal stress UspA family protein|nr:universal stress protein [Janthinobacterium sp.]